MDNGFIKGALIGGVLAGVAGILLAPKAGNQLIEDIVDVFNNAQHNGKGFFDAVKEKGSCLANLRFKEEETTEYSSLLMGLILGSLVAGITALLLTPQSGKKMRKILGSQYDDICVRAEDFVSSVEKKGEKIVGEACEWKDSLTDLVNKLTSSRKSSKNSSSHSSINDILDLANMGLNVYQKIQNRR